jgi:hypothetical protein
MSVTNKQRRELKEFTKDELIDYIEQLLSKIERLTQNKEDECKWILKLPKEIKMSALDDMCREGKIGEFIVLSKVLLNAPISEGGVATEEIEQIRKKYLEKRFTQNDKL